MSAQATLEKVSALAKRRGFIWPGSDLYGGLANVYDFGPYGEELKENVRKLWREKFVTKRDDIYCIDSSILIRPEVWEASGHTSGFADVMVEDKVSHKRYRADHLIEDALPKILEKKTADILDMVRKKAPEMSTDQEAAMKRGKVDGFPPELLAKIIVALDIKSPDGNELSEPKRFNQLFETKIGIIAGEKNQAYLRGEIAQGLFLNFKNFRDTLLPNLPFGIAQIGKAFRNVITPGQLTHRTLEFDLMEFEYFFDPDKQDWNELFEYWKNEVEVFALSLGIDKKNTRWRPHESFELSHYSKRTEDLEFSYPWGFKEWFAVAYRTDFDLSNHAKHTRKDLSYMYPDGSRFVPHVIEPTFGLSRTMTVLLMDAYCEDEVNGKTRVYLKLHPLVAPVKVAVFPLQKDEKLIAKAKEVYQTLKANLPYNIEYDESGNIGKLYRRQDEIGTPWCVTVDYETLNDSAVTIRDRDTLAQERINISELAQKFKSMLEE